MDGFVFSIFWFSSLRIVRIRSYSKLYRTISFLCRVFLRIRTVVIGLRFLSRKDSIIVSFVIFLRIVFSFRIFVCSRIAFSSLSISVFVFVDTCTNWFLSFYFFGRMSYWESSFLTRFGLVFGLSILFIVIIIGICVVFACWIVSMVCGIISSSVVIIRITMFVVCVLRVRIEVNAACFGVFRKVIMSFLVLTWYVLMCWVMSFVSLEVIFVERM